MRNDTSTEPQTFVGDSPIPETSDTPPDAPSGGVWTSPDAPADPNAAPASPFGQTWASIRSAGEAALRRFSGLDPATRTGLGVAAGAAALAAVGGAAYAASRGMRPAPAAGGFPFFGGMNPFGGGVSPFMKKVVKPYAKPFMKPVAKPFFGGYGKQVPAFFQKPTKAWGK